MRDPEDGADVTFVISYPVSVLVVPDPTTPNQMTVIGRRAQKPDGTSSKYIPVYTELLHAERALTTFASKPVGCKVFTFDKVAQFVKFLKVMKTDYDWVAFDPLEKNPVWLLSIRRAIEALDE